MLINSDNPITGVHTDQNHQIIVQTSGSVSLCEHMYYLICSEKQLLELQRLA